MRETSLALLKREGVTFQGSLCSPLKSGGFGCKNGCTSKGYGERETSLALLEREGHFFRACFARLLKVVVFMPLRLGIEIILKEFHEILSSLRPMSKVLSPNFKTEDVTLIT